MLSIDIEKLFSSEKGKAVLAEARRAMTDHAMWPHLLGGVLVGLSGGADSVMLLLVLQKMYDVGLCKKILAVHVNHKIRPGEAERDADFSRGICDALGVEFILSECDVPTLAKASAQGIEEAARNARYSVFNEILQSRNDVSCIMTAHNSTDNLETVIINMLRGAGTRGLSGIAPVRGNVLRPLIYSSKSDIEEALSSCGVPYVVDSTNLDTTYTRNFVRHTILPHLSEISKNPEAIAIRNSKALRQDADYLDSVARDFLAEYSDGIPTCVISNLHPAIRRRVISLMAKRGGASGIEAVHVDKIGELLSGGDFSLSLPGQVSFVVRRGVATVGEPDGEEKIEYEYSLSLGETLIPETGCKIIISESPIEDSSPNVYKKSKKCAVDFDIIDGGLTVREKRDGDKYVFGGKTRKLKKLFNDAALTESERKRLPVICDGAGILWVPGFQVRDGGAKNAQKKVFIAVVE